MSTLLERLQNHDWFYEYSDDHRVWKRGEARIAELTAELKALECQYPMKDIRMTVTGMIKEDFTPDDSGYWYKKSRKYKNAAGVKEANLIDLERAEEIELWLNECKHD